MNGDKLTRLTAYAAVLAVAGVAAWISYRHAVAVVTAHGEAGAVGHWYPVVIDGLIVAASMVLLDAARHEDTAPRLAWHLLGAGIAATLGVNVLAGLPSGWLAALVATWPALAFVGCYELVMMLVRAGARRGPTALQMPVAIDPAGGEAQQPDATPGAPAGVPAAVPDFSVLNGHRAKAERLFAGDVESGRVPGIRRIRDGLHVGQPKAKLVQEYLKQVAQAGPGSGPHGASQR